MRLAVTSGDAGEDSSSQNFPLPPDETAAGAARSHVRTSLVRWGMSGVVEPLTLIASELVSNAVRYGRPPLQLLLRRAGSTVRIDVHDEMPSREPPLPAKPPTDPDAEGGRGMLIRAPTRRSQSRSRYEFSGPVSPLRGRFPLGMIAQ